MITLFPAIDILDGNAVRLYLGRRDQVTVYGSPLEMARRWRDEGAKYLHVVDLNGAFDGTRVNNRVIEKIVAQTGLSVQVGGGIRSSDAIRAYLEAGVQRVILGTAIFSKDGFLERALDDFGAERIVCGLDVKDGKIAVKGWLATVDATATETGKRWKQMGVRTVVYTDVSRDGALSGINRDACAALSEQTGLDVIASGGLKSLEDVRLCAERDLYGVILGKALYEKTILLKEAVRLAEEICH